MFQQEHLDGILNRVQEKTQTYGFRKKRKGRFIKEANDQLLHAIDIGFYRRFGELWVTPCLAVLHYGVGALLSEGLPARAAHQRAREFEATLILEPIKSIIARKNNTGALSDYVVQHPAGIGSALATIWIDLDSTAVQFFSRVSSIPDLIAHFERDGWAGGVAHDLKLMALYYYVGRYADLRAMAAALNSGNASPMTLSMREFLLAKATSRA